MSSTAGWMRGLCLLFAVGAAGAGAASPRPDPFVPRPFPHESGGRPLGEGIAYGPHRDGQRPGEASPSKGEVREDLRMMAERWSLVRLYGSVGPADSILEVLRAERLPMKALLGVWIAPEDARDSTGRVVERFPEAEAANRAEVESAVRLAAAYPGLVAALCVGNETQVFWSSHRVPAPLLAGYVRELRARTSVPITVADDYLFWNTPASADLAAEIDFIVAHFHPLWAGQTNDGSLDWTRKAYDEVRARHSARLVVIGETGWATGKLSTARRCSNRRTQNAREPLPRIAHPSVAWLPLLGERDELLD
ncbi:MAG TPA: hypothetical protein VLT84_06065, partial [Acidobacteriota bacterium]|nr:hypothetical protein [Acidobacteriota bacterium]